MNEKELHNLWEKKVGEVLKEVGSLVATDSKQVFGEMPAFIRNMLETLVKMTGKPLEFPEEFIRMFEKKVRTEVEKELKELESHNTAVGQDDTASG